MKISKILFLSAVATLSLFSSCKEDEPVTPDNDALLKSGKWKLTGLTEAGVSTYGSLAACEKDNTTTFQSDGKILDDEGATKCDPTDPQTNTDVSWAWTDATKTKFIMTDNLFGITVTVTELTSTKLVLTYSNPVDQTVNVETYGK